MYVQRDVYSKKGEYIWHKLMDGSMAGGIDDVQMYSVGSGMSWEREMGRKMGRDMGREMMGQDGRSREV